MIDQPESSPTWILRTPRLSLVSTVACDGHVDFLYRLWTNPKVMTFVGFPRGLRTTSESIKSNLVALPGGEYDRPLLVQREIDGSPIGQAKLGSPDASGIANTDVKLLPEYWGFGFGTEIKRALVDYLFSHTDCSGVRATPNQNNIASIKMQEAVGGRRVGEGRYRFPREMQDYTIDVPYFEYVVYRKDWRPATP